MKKIVLLSFSLVSLYASAQNVKLEVGKTFKVTSSIVTTGELMGQDMSSNINTISSIKINSIEKDNYKGTATVTSMKTSGSVMGQDYSFDSDKKSDLTSPIGEKVAGSLNKATEFTIDKNTGAQKEAAKEEDGGMGMMGGNESKSPYGLFLIDALNKKIGDKWSTTTTVEGLKTITNFEVMIIKDGKITVSTNSTVKGTMNKDVQGQSMEMNIDTKSTGSLVLDSVTGLIQTQNMDSESTINMEVGGQSMAIVNKTKLTSTIE